GKPKRLSWSEPAREAFGKLKLSFTTTPILCHPDPKTPFVVEVDASNLGIGAMLSQHQSNTAALEEWRHWLKGARHPFLVLTDHRNLEYLRGDFCETLGINVSLSSGYHSQSNGQAERLNQEIGRFLRAYCSREQHRWSYQPHLFPWSEEASDVSTVDYWARHSQEIWEQAHVRLQRA
ncbi:hypothetical protein QTP86_017134, partial [Hemibagrus guttatus]